MTPEQTTLFFRSLGLLFIALILDLTLRFVGFWVRKADPDSWVAILRKSLKVPLHVLIWGIAIITLFIAAAHEHLLPYTEPFLVSCREIFIIIVLAWAVILFKGQLTQRLIREIGKPKFPVMDRDLLITINKLLTIFIFAVAALYVLDAVGVSLTAVLAFGGIGGLAVGWAAKDVIANFFGGLMIFLNRPFGEGDWIKSTNKNFEGVVESIGWYMTRIRTFERRPTFVPNALITDSIIENPGRMYHRRIRETISLRYQDFEKVQPVTEAIKKMLREHPQIDSHQFLFAELVHYGEYALEIDVYCFSKATRFADFRIVQQEILLKIGEIVKKHEADFAYPTRLNYSIPLQKGS